MKGSKRKKVNGQIFEKAANIRACRRDSTNKCFLTVKYKLKANPLSQVCASCVFLFASQI